MPSFSMWVPGSELRSSGLWGKYFKLSHFPSSSAAFFVCLFVLSTQKLFWWGTSPSCSHLVTLVQHSSPLWSLVFLCILSWILSVELFLRGLRYILKFSFPGVWLRWCAFCDQIPGTIFMLTSQFVSDGDTLVGWGIPVCHLFLLKSLLKTERVYPTLPGTPPVLGLRF